MKAWPTVRLGFGDSTSGQELREERVVLLLVEHSLFLALPVEFEQRQLTRIFFFFSSLTFRHSHNYSTFSSYQATALVKQPATLFGVVPS